MKKLIIFNRLSALVYDIILQVILAITVLIGVEFLNEKYLKLEDLYKNIVMVGTYFVLFIILFTLIPKKIKGTLGKYFADLKVITQCGKITFGRWLFRELILKYLYPYLGLIALLIVEPFTLLYFAIYMGTGLFVEIIFIIIKRRTIHDYFLKTIVVKAEDSIE